MSADTTTSKAPRALEVFPVTWTASDGGPGPSCRVTVFGKCPDGQSACLHVRFTPFLFVEAKPKWTESRCKLLIAEASQRYGCIGSKSRVVRRTSLWGFQGERMFVLLAFETMAAHRQARYALKRDGYQTCEAAVDPVVRLLHLRGLGPCRWLRVTAWNEPQRLEADVDVEVECDFTAVHPSDRTTRPPLVFASECVLGFVFGFVAPPRAQTPCDTLQSLTDQPAFTPPNEAKAGT